MIATPTVRLLLVLGAAAAVLALLHTPVVRRSQLWTITVTPLASIIGSGFLVSAPLLYAHFGSRAVPAVILINALAIGIGLAIRHNIQYFDPRRAEIMTEVPLLRVLGRTAGFTLALSYMISVAFYVALMSAFVLESAGAYHPAGVRILGTLVLATIAATGFFKGLHGLEAVEKAAVNFKMAIIGGLLFVLVLFWFGGGGSAHIPRLPFTLTSLRALGGMLLITQGFETAKYLGHQYEIRPRLRAMLLAQLLALGVYVSFVGLVGPLVQGVDLSRETAIIAIVDRLAPGLGVALSIAAILSQFSAAVADTVGTGGIVQQESRGRLSERGAYVGIALVAIGLLWMLDVFQVMSVASRAFAAYYALQCLIAFQLELGRPPSAVRNAKLLGFPVLAALLALIMVFSIPAE